MRTRKQALGDMNIIGAKVEQQRKAIGMKRRIFLLSFRSEVLTSMLRVSQSLKVSSEELPIMSLKQSQSHLTSALNGFSAARNN